MIITCCFRPPRGAIKGLNSLLEIIFKKANTESKICFVAGDFNLDCLHYKKNLDIQTFYNRIFAHGCIPLITKLTRVTCKTVSLINKIFTNLIFDTLLKLKKGFVKSGVSHRFRYFFSYVLHQKFKKKTKRLLFIKG